MSSSNYILRVNNPCKESWETMSVVDGGKHCSTCAKNVIDFSGLSDRQIIDILNRSEGKICGRLDKTQLNRVVATPNEPKRVNAFYKFLVGIAFLSGADGVQGQNVPAKQIIAGNYVINSQPLTVDETSGPPQTDSSPKFITGKIIDAETKEPVPGASIQIKGTKFGTMADANGLFKLAIRDEFLEKPLVVAISFIGFVTQELTLIRKDLLTNREFPLSLDQSVLGEVTVVAPQTIRPLTRLKFRE